MMSREYRGLALFFTLGVSLVDWHRSGFLQREVKYYSRLAEQIGQVTFVTYGGEADKALADSLAGIRVLPNVRGLLPEVFMRQAVRQHRQALSGIGIAKSNQIKGAEAVLQAASLLGARPVIRGGYLLSRFNANRPISPRMQFGLWRREMALFHQAARVFLPTDDDARYARRWYALPAEKVVVLPNYVDTGLFAPRDDVACEPGLVTFVGRLAPQKNLPALLEAMSGIKDVRLRLIGDGPQRAELAELAARHHVRLEMTGVVPHSELPRLLAESDIFVLPSFYEGMPKALLEAMSAGVPVVATQVQGTSALIRHRETGWLCHDTSASCLRQAIESLLHDSRLRAQIGRAGRQFVMQRFSLDRVLSLELAVYREMGLA